MNYRNPKYNENGTVDCEIEHPVYGWIPFTADPDDVEENGRTIFAEVKAHDADPAHPTKIAAHVPHVPTPEELEAKRIAQIENEATQRIEQAYSNGEQMIMMAQALSIIEKMTSGNPVTTDENVKLGQIKDAWSKINQTIAIKEEAKANGKQPNEVAWNNIR